jgi:hypothetical protein
MTFKPEDHSRVSLTISDWVKILIFLGIQSVAILGGVVSLCERIASLETRVMDREQSLSELRHDVNDLRRELQAQRGFGRD